MQKEQVQAVVDAAHEVAEILTVVQEWREARIACMECFEKNYLDCDKEVVRLGNAEAAMAQASRKEWQLNNALSRLKRGSPIYCGIRRPRIS